MQCGHAPESGKECDGGITPMQLIGLAGIALILLVAWSLSENRRAFPVRIVLWGFALQFLFAFAVLKVPGIVDGFQWLGDAVTRFLGFAQQGAQFVFGRLVDPAYRETFGFIFAFTILPTIIFFSAVMAVLYHLGIMQKIVYAMGWLMQKTLRTSNIESLAAAANVFFGQTEAVLTVRPYLSVATRSELFAMMVGGFVTIAGGVLAGYIQMGIPATDLIAASIISAPAGLMIAKILVPATGQELDRETAIPENIYAQSQNVLEAAVNGTTEGIRLAVNIAAMLIVFLAFIALADALFHFLYVHAAMPLGWNGFPKSLQEFFGILLSPIAYIVGVPSQDVEIFGGLIGTKIALNEFVAYAQLSEYIQAGTLSERTIHLATFALCGFANFGSIAIQIGGIGGLVPERKAELAQIGVKAMFGGVLANLLTAAVVSLLLP